MGNKFSGKARNGSANNPETGALLTGTSKNNPEMGAFKSLNSFFCIPIMGDYSIYRQSVSAKATGLIKTGRTRFMGCAPRLRGSGSQMKKARIQAVAYPLQEGVFTPVRAGARVEGKLA